MTKEQIAVTLYESANKNGLIPTLYAVFGKNISVSIPFSQKACNDTIEEIQFTVRSYNSMKRAGLSTIGEVIESLQDESLLRVRNLGKKSYCEIQTKILSYGYDRLSEREKIAFFRDVAERNCTYRKQVS